MGKLGLPELTTNQIELLSKTAETAAKKYVLSKISLKLVETLNIIVETTSEKPVTISVEVILVLSPKTKNINVELIAKEAVKEALKTSENYLSNLK
ncbi:DUF3194 domain-containing protein [Candidatus Bathyarchaeota archaeon]|nr:DUF3194 domain-containing protein [Candidatus Bathyarchaeota archaeon]